MEIKTKFNVGDKVHFITLQKVYLAKVKDIFCSGRDYGEPDDRKIFNTTSYVIEIEDLSDRYVPEDDLCATYDEAIDAIADRIVKGIYSNNPDILKKVIYNIQKKLFYEFNIY